MASGANGKRRDKRRRARKRKARLKQRLSDKAAKDTGGESVRKQDQHS